MAQKGPQGLFWAKLSFSMVAKKTCSRRPEVSPMSWREVVTHVLASDPGQANTSALTDSERDDLRLFSPSTVAPSSALRSNRGSADRSVAASAVESVARRSPELHTDLERPERERGSRSTSLLWARPYFAPKTPSNAETSRSPHPLGSAAKVRSSSG